MQHVDDVDSTFADDEELIKNADVLEEGYTVEQILRRDDVLRTVHERIQTG